MKNSDDGFLADFFSLIGGEAGHYRFSMLQSTGIGDSGMPASDLRKARRAMYCPIGIKSAISKARRWIWSARSRRRAFEIALYMPIGQYIARRAFRKSLAGIPESPIPVLWSIEKR